MVATATVLAGEVAFSPAPHDTVRQAARSADPIVLNGITTLGAEVSRGGMHVRSG
jgi:hypothetical protein